jgi:hypothetical protein
MESYPSRAFGSFSVKECLCLGTGASLFRRDDFLVGNVELTLAGIHLKHVLIFVGLWYILMIVVHHALSQIPWFISRHPKGIGSNSILQIFQLLFQQFRWLFGDHVAHTVILWSGVMAATRSSSNQLIVRYHQQGTCIFLRGRFGAFLFFHGRTFLWKRRGLRQARHGVIRRARMLGHRVATATSSCRDGSHGGYRIHNRTRHPRGFHLILHPLPFHFVPKDLIGRRSGVYEIIYQSSPSKSSPFFLRFSWQITCGREPRGYELL